MTMEEWEAALDSGSLFVQARNGNWWRVRRNGKTQTWKTRPWEFRIPFKAGFRTCGAITHGVQNYKFKIEPAQVAEQE